MSDYLYPNYQLADGRLANGQFRIRREDYTLEVNIGGQWRVAASSGLAKVVSTQQANEIKPGQWLICVTDESTVQLPEGKAGQEVKISTLGTCNSVIVSAFSGQTIEGDSQFVIQSSRNLVHFLFVGDEWIIIDSNMY